MAELQREKVEKEIMADGLRERLTHEVPPEIMIEIMFSHFIKLISTNDAIKIAEKYLTL